MLNQNSFFDKLIDEISEDIKIITKPRYRGAWSSVIGKYSSEAHFVNELLQNADDCKATEVNFTISKEGLWFKHNGKIRFSISDPDTYEIDTKNGTLGHINAITSIGNSSKGFDEEEYDSDEDFFKIDKQKIGKFGIGFKAVFAYTLTPEIYDDNFAFRLSNYILPEKIQKNHPFRKEGETLFYFPFNHTDKSAEKAYEEVSFKLSNLDYPLLFLNNLLKISWENLETKGYYKKELVTNELIRRDLVFNLEEYSITSVFNKQRRALF
jgi:hypothetical protein